MIPLFGRLFHILFLDEAVAQRWVGALLLLLGTVLTNGGAVPGTTIVLPLGSWAPWAALLGSFVVTPAAIFIAAGGGLPEGTPPSPAVEMARARVKMVEAAEKAVEKKP